MEFYDGKSEYNKKNHSDLAINVRGYRLGLVKNDPPEAVSDLSGEGIPSSKPGLFIKAPYVYFVSDLHGLGKEERGTLHTALCFLTQEKDKVVQKGLTFPDVKTNTYLNPVRESFEANFVPVRLLEPGARALVNADNIAPEGITSGTMLSFCDGQTAWFPVPLKTMEEAVKLQQVQQADPQNEYRADVTRRAHEALVTDGIEASYAVKDASPWVHYETLDVGTKEKVEVEKAGLLRTKTRTINERVTSRAPAKLDARIVKMIHGLRYEIEHPEGSDKNTAVGVVTVDSLGGSIPMVVVDQDSENPADAISKKFAPLGVAFARASFLEAGEECTVLFNPDLFKPGLPRMTEVTRIRFKDRPENFIESGESKTEIVQLPQKELLVLGEVKEVFDFATKKFAKRVGSVEIDQVTAQEPVYLPDNSDQIASYEPPKKGAKFNSQHKPA